MGNKIDRDTSILFRKQFLHLRIFKKFLRVYLDVFSEVNVFIISGINANT